MTLVRSLVDRAYRPEYSTFLLREAPVRQAAVRG
jgi:hypothetical protein